MSRTLVALIAVAAAGMPFIGYAGMQLVFGNAPDAPRAALVADASAPSSTATLTTGGVGQAPVKRVVSAITITAKDDLELPPVRVAQAETAPDPIADAIGENAPDLAPMPRDTAEPQPMPRPREGLQNRPETAESAAAAPAAAANDCLAIGDLVDKDGDFKRNAKALGGLCIQQSSFRENGIGWVIHTIRRTDGKGGPLWAVPHDNEDAAFDSGIWALNAYGGTMVSVETGGNRENGSIDPNRNFTGNASACGRTSPLFTAAFIDHVEAGQPIVGLHSNTLKGNVSINGSLPNTTPHKAPRPSPFIKAKSDEDTLVFVASLKPDGQDPVVDKVVADLLASGMNVMREHVTPQGNDCSFSNYAALKGLPKYFNIEVVHGDGAAQRAMIELIMKM